MNLPYCAIREMSLKFNSLCCFAVKIPLDELRNYANLEYGPYHSKIIAEHYGIFKDLFENAYFYPVVEMKITYQYDEELITPVYRGNIIPPSDVTIFFIITMSVRNGSILFICVHFLYICSNYIYLQNN